MSFIHYTKALDGTRPACGTTELHQSISIDVAFVDCPECLSMVKPQTLTTFRRADGNPIDDWDWVPSLEWFDPEFEDYVEIIKDEYVLTNSTLIVMGNTSRWCHTCDQDMELDQPVDGPVYCDACQPEEPND